MPNTINYHYPRLLTSLNKSSAIDCTINVSRPLESIRNRNRMGFMPAACAAIFLSHLPVYRRASYASATIVPEYARAIPRVMIHKRAAAPASSIEIGIWYAILKRIGSRAGKRQVEIDVIRRQTTTTDPIRSDGATKSENPTTRHTYRDVLKRG